MKVDSTTLLIIGAAAVAIYFISKPTVAVPPPLAYNPYAVNPYAVNPLAGNTTAQDISAGGAATSSVLNALSNLF